MTSEYKLRVLCFLKFFNHDFFTLMFLYLMFLTMRLTGGSGNDSR